MSIPAPHNLTFAANQSGILSLINVVDNNLMNNTFGIGVLISIFVILMFYFIRTGSGGRAFAASAFLTFMLSFLLFLLGLVTDLVMFACMAIAAFSIAFIKAGD